MIFIVEIRFDESIKSTFPVVNFNRDKYVVQKVANNEVWCTEKKNALPWDCLTNDKITNLIWFRNFNCI